MHESWKDLIDSNVDKAQQVLEKNENDPLDIMVFVFLSFHLGNIVIYEFFKDVAYLV